MYKIITIISSGIFFGSAIIYFYKNFNNTTHTNNFFPINHTLNTIDLSNTLIHQSIINAINDNNSNKLDNHTQTENNIDNPDLNKSTQIDDHSILNEFEKVIEKNPEKYNWYFI